MRRITMIVELSYDDELFHGSNVESYKWLMNDVIQNENSKLTLVSNEVGDTIGEIKVIEIIDFYTQVSAKARYKKGS